MFLNIEYINEFSPYPVTDYCQYLAFTTDEGIDYKVTFQLDSSGYFGDNAYHFIFAQLKNDSKHSVKDENVQKTLLTIIEAFFKNDAHILIYICDATDERQLARHRLFKRWFQKYETDFCITDDIINFKDLNGNPEIQCAAIIIKKSNPKVHEYISIFCELIASLKK